MLAVSLANRKEYQAGFRPERKVADRFVLKETQEIYREQVDTRSSCRPFLKRTIL